MPKLGTRTNRPGGGCYAALLLANSSVQQGPMLLKYRYFLTDIHSKIPVFYYGLKFLSTVFRYYEARFYVFLLSPIFKIFTYP